MPASQAASELGVSRSQLYQIYADYLRAVPSGRLDQWQPGVSGGSRRNAINKKAEALLRKLLSADPPALAVLPPANSCAVSPCGSIPPLFAVLPSPIPSAPPSLCTGHPAPPFAAGNARIPVLSGNSTLPLTRGFLLSSRISPCPTSSTIAPGSFRRREHLSHLPRQSPHRPSPFPSQLQGNPPRIAHDPSPCP